jgi:hypothetical protein
MPGHNATSASCCQGLGCPMHFPGSDTWMQDIITLIYSYTGYPICIFVCMCTYNGKTCQADADRTYYSLVRGAIIEKLACLCGLCGLCGGGSFSAVSALAEGTSSWSRKSDQA